MHRLNVKAATESFFHRRRFLLISSFVLHPISLSLIALT